MRSAAKLRAELEQKEIVTAKLKTMCLKLKEKAAGADEALKSASQNYDKKREEEELITAKLDAEIKRLNAANAEHTRVLEEKNSLVSKLSEAKDGADAAIEMLKSKIATLEETAAQAHDSSVRTEELRKEKDMAEGRLEEVLRVSREKEGKFKAVLEKLKLRIETQSAEAEERMKNLTSKLSEVRDASNTALDVQKKKCAELEEVLGSTRTELEECKTFIDNDRSMRESLEAEKKSLEKEIEALRASMATSESMTQKLKKVIGTLRRVQARNKDLTGESERLKSDLQDSESTRETLALQLDAREKEIAAMKEALCEGDNLAAQLEDAKLEIAEVRQTNEKTVSALQNQLEDIREECKHLKQNEQDRVASAEERLALQEEFTEASQRATDLEAELASVKEKFDKYRKMSHAAVKNANAQVESSKAHCADIEKKLEDATALAGALDAELASAVETRDASASRLADVERMLEDVREQEASATMELGNSQSTTRSDNNRVCEHTATVGD